MSSPGKDLKPVVFNDCPSWRLATTSLWRTAAHCTQPEPRASSAVGVRRHSKAPLIRRFGMDSESRQETAKGWGPFELPSLEINPIT